MKCKKCGEKLDKKYHNCPNCGAKVKKSMVWLILLIIFASIIFLALVFLVAYNLFKSPYVGTWETENSYEDYSIIISLKIKDNHTFTYRTYKRGEDNYFEYYGKWKEENDKLLLKLKLDGKQTDLEVYKKNNKELCLYDKDCVEESKLYKKNPFKIHKNRIEKIEEEPQAEAEEEKEEYSFDTEYNPSEDSNKALIYLFYGDGCPHCAEFIDFLNNLDEKTKDKFVVLMYETWNNDKNADLMEEIMDELLPNEEPGVPFIMINDKKWLGYTESYENGILDAINNYNPDGYDLAEDFDF